MHGKIHFFSLSEKVMTDTESFNAIEFFAGGRKLCKMCCQVRAYTVEVASCFFNVLCCNRNGNISFLNNGIGYIRYLMVLMQVKRDESTLAGGEEDNILTGNYVFLPR